MDLDFTEEQDLLRETVRGICAQYAPVDVVRAQEDDPVGYPAELWKQLAGLDLIGLTLPEAYGGSGQSLLEAAIVYEELGKALAPSPHFVSAVMTGGLIARAGSEAQKKDWLPRIASGEAVVTVAWLEPDHGFGPEGVTALADPTDGGWEVSGTKWHVPFAAAAEALLVLAAHGDDEIGMFLVERDAAGVTLEQLKTIDSATQYAVTFERAAAERVGEASWADWDATMREGIVLLAAQAIGGARAALDITVEYASNREQFDKPLAAFQSISHYLADADTAIEGGRVLVYEAAWAQSVGRPITRLAPMAKSFACRTFRETTATAVQIWGGMGFTLEADIQLYFRRAKALQLNWWDERYLDELVAIDVLD
ncbi:MAG: acyl-CoA/acyl-ACP dehydrogenase [Acidimicrobiia bacterium]|nr:acyl-CoA/acyl-ACP dehydrogenase [Acidimicrobiia bacterium]